MRSYLVRRLLAIVPTLLAVSVAIFLLLHAAPGGPMAGYATNPTANPEALKRPRAAGPAARDRQPLDARRVHSDVLARHRGAADLLGEAARPAVGRHGDDRRRLRADRPTLAPRRSRGGAGPARDRGLEPLPPVDAARGHAPGPTPH